jgi:hypothetical protein
MAISIQWDNDDKQIIRGEVNGRWTWAELHNALEKTIEMMDSVSYKVDFILDVSHSRFIPGGATQAVQSVATPQTHPNEGIKVIVGANAILRFAYEAYRRINQGMGKNQEFLFAKTQDEARDLITRERNASS